MSFQSRILHEFTITNDEGNMQANDFWLWFGQQAEKPYVTSITFFPDESPSLSKAVGGGTCFMTDESGAEKIRKDFLKVKIRKDFLKVSSFVPAVGVKPSSTENFFAKITPEAVAEAYDVTKMAPIRGQFVNMSVHTCYACALSVLAIRNNMTTVDALELISQHESSAYMKRFFANLFNCEFFEIEEFIEGFDSKNTMSVCAATDLGKACAKLVFRE